MSFSSLLLLGVDCISALVIFYLLPDTIIRYVRSALPQPNGRSFRFLLDQIPGFIFGSALAAVIVLLFGASYESLIVRTARTVGDLSMQAVGMDATTRCVNRLIEENFKFVTPTQFIEMIPEANYELFNGTVDDRVSVLMMAMPYLGNTFDDQSDLMQIGALEVCKRRVGGS